MEDPTKKPQKPKAPRTAAQRAAFDKARVVGAMHEGSPRERNQEKVLAALDHIHGWGYSTSAVTARACRCRSTSFITGMARAGLVRYEVVLGRKYLLLTKKGVEFLRGSVDPDDSIETQRAAMTHTHVVSLFAAQHNEYAQEIVARWRAACWEPHQWLPERQLRVRLADRMVDGAKVPDACFFTEKEVVFLEVERSKKSKKEVEIMLLNLVRLLENKATHRVEIHFLRPIEKIYRDVYTSWLRDGVLRFYTSNADGSTSFSGDGPLTPSMRDALGRIQLITVEK